MKWKRQKPQHDSGDYWFSGRCVATRGVIEEFSQEEAIAIAEDIHRIAHESGGIDYLQKYEYEETGRVIWVIDQVTRSALQNGDHPEEHNYFTILFPEEY